MTGDSPTTPEELVITTDDATITVGVPIGSEVCISIDRFDIFGGYTQARVWLGPKWRKQVIAALSAGLEED